MSKIDSKKIENFRTITLARNDGSYMIERIDEPVDGGEWYMHTNNAGLSFEYKLKKTLKILNKMTEKEGYSVVNIE